MIDLSTWKKMWELLERRERRNAWFVLTIVVVAALASAAMIGSVMPFLTVLARPQTIHEVKALSEAYRMFGYTSDYAFLVALGFASLGVIVVANVLQILRIWAVVRFASQRSYSFSYRLMATYLRQPYEYFIDHHSGDMSTRLLSEAQIAVDQFLQPAANAIASLLTTTVVVLMLVWVNPVVALTAFAVFGGVYGFTLIISRGLVRRAGRLRAEANAKRFRIANEALGGIKDIKLLGREGIYLDHFREAVQQVVRSARLVALIGQLPRYTMQIVAFGGIIVLCLVLVSPKGLSSGRALGDILPLLGVLAFAGQRLMPELSTLYQSLAQLQFGRSAIETLHADLVGTVSGSPLPKTIPMGLGLVNEIALERVSYRYPKVDVPSIEDISLSIRAGEKVGIVGTSGAGKSTFADIVLGLLRPTAGRMTVDGREITEDCVRAWQQSVGYVPQDIFLTDSSIAENIALGISSEDINAERVVRAARIAQLDRFITEELPEGYDTTVGERGVRLSGGQKQRIGIARAMYHEAELIVFDEATSALDNVTEREVMSAIDNLPGDKTVLIIAHRLSTVRRCDRILFLESGRVSGFDSWDGLMSASEGFRKIAQAS